MIRPQLRSHHALLLACVGLYVLSAAQVRTAGDRTALSGGVAAIQRPMLFLVGLVTGGWESILAGRQELERTAGELEAVRREVEELRQSNQLLSAEVAALRQGSELLRELPSLSSGAVLARVVARDALRSHTVRIDRGAVDGVRVDSPVLAGSGVLGRVDQVFSHAARVQLLTHPGAAAAARLAGTGLEGLVMGGDNPTLTGLPPYTEIAPETAVVTTGSEGIYPPNLLLGSTEPARTEGLFTLAPVRLTARPSEVLVVLVLPPGAGSAT